MSKSLLFILLFFIGIAWWLYRDTFGAGLVTDQVGWLMTYEHFGWRGMFHAFNDKSLHLVYHWFGFGLWKLFGWDGIGWGISFIALHAVVATLSYSVFSQLLLRLKISSAHLIAFFGSLIFLVSPYHTEPLVWYACVHYLVCSILLLLSIQQFLNYTQNHLLTYVLRFYLFFALAVFTLEISFTLPLIITALIILLPQTEITKNKLHLFLVFVLPSFLLVGFYFLMNYFLKGSAAGHYGADTHFNFSIPLIMGNLSKYAAKVFGFTQFLPYEKRNVLYLFFEKSKYGYLLFGVLLGVATLTFWQLKRLPKSIRYLLFLVAAFAFALAPIINLFFSSIVNVEGDRLSYWANLFSAQLISFALISLFSYVGVALVLVYMFFSVEFLHVNTQAWASNKAIQTSLLQSFSAEKADHIYLLNVPDNFNGSYMFRSFAPDNSFAETLWLKECRDIRPKVTQVLSYNMIKLNDGVCVEVVDSSSLKVIFNQWGNWWWQGGIGAANYSTADLTVVIDEWSHSYTISFKAKKSNAVYLYQDGGIWKKVDGF